jgi:hypothetical protein
LTLEEIIDRVQIDWAALEYVLAGLTPEQLVSAGPEAWSVKDHLAHIGAWDGALAAVLGGRTQADGFGVDPDAFDGIDALNEALYQRSHSLEFDQVQDNARRAHAEMLAALGHLTDADLNEPLRHRIEVDSYAHYAEHVGWIKELLASLG